MSDFAILTPPEGLDLVIQTEGHPRVGLLPMDVPLHFAEHCADGEVLCWMDPEQDSAGFFRPNVRVEWSRDAIRLVQIAFLLPGSRGPGVVGLEVGSGDAEEQPALAIEGYSREALDWFKGQRVTLGEMFGTAISVVEYGREA